MPLTMMLTKTMTIKAKIEICKTFDNHDEDFGDDNDSDHRIFWITMIIGDLDPDHKHGYKMICMTRPCDNDDDDDDDKDDNADAAFDDNEIKEVHTHWATRSGLRDGSLVMHFSLNQHHQHYHYHHCHELWHDHLH